MRFILENKIPIDIWNHEIKTFFVHDIKTQGKHFKKNTEIIKYNTVLQKIPRIYEITNMPKIVYKNTLLKNPARIKKFLYARKCPNIKNNDHSEDYLDETLYSVSPYSLIIEYSINNQNSKQNLMDYYNNIDNVNNIKDFT
jgi:hypothetical protein